MKCFAIPPSSQGALIVTNSGRCRKAVLDAAFYALNLGKLLPRREKKGIALRAAILAYLATAGRKKARWECNPLDRKVLGFEVVEEIKGQEKNTHSYLYTVKADSTGQCWVTVDGLHDPNLDAAAAEITRIYRDRLEWYEASTVGALLIRAIERAWSGTGLRDGGGVYFLAGGLLPQFRALAAAIEASPANPDSEVRLSVATFQVTDNPEVARDAIAAFREEAKKMMAEISADLLGAHEMTGPGKQGRRDRIENVRTKAQAFKQMFGATLDDIDALVDATENRMAMLDLEEVSA